eukprot:Amastigsp_a182708_4.p1 type:complete len:157 gc:universal Amastigsp_a182708_4:514-44(-)
MTLAVSSLDSAHQPRRFWPLCACANALESPEVRRARGSARGARKLASPAHAGTPHLSPMSPTRASPRKQRQRTTSVPQTSSRRQRSLWRRGQSPETHSLTASAASDQPACPCAGRWLSEQVSSTAARSSPRVLAACIGLLFPVCIRTSSPTRRLQS